jgi:hypothetical protein
LLEKNSLQHRFIQSSDTAPLFLQGTTMKSLVKLLKITLVEEDETLNKEINNRLFDHIMGAIESVSGKFGHYYIEVCIWPLGDWFWLLQV